MIGGRQLMESARGWDNDGSAEAHAYAQKQAKILKDKQLPMRRLADALRSLPYHAHQENIRVLATLAFDLRTENNKLRIALQSKASDNE